MLWRKIKELNLLLTYDYSAENSESWVAEDIAVLEIMSAMTWLKSLDGT
jgi:hypothetical protein